MQVTTTEDTTSFTLEWLLRKKQKITSVGQEVEKLVLLGIAGGNVT